MRRVEVLALVLSIGAVVGAAEETRFTFPRSAPEAQGISSAAILGFVEEAEQKLDALHSFMLVRHGQVVAEGWWGPYAADEPHMLFSLSKSFTSTAVGLAVADGKLNVDDPVLGFFSEEAPAEPSANLKAMRVRDLLTMSTGHHDEEIRDFPYNGDESVVKNFLARPVSHKPGTFFVYNTPASYMLSAIVQKVTGQPVVDYLRPRLFEPLGIADPTWEASKQGVSMGGFGLSVRTEDIARFGQLYLQKGQWQGKQLLPAAWVETATSRQMSNGSSPTSDWEQGYGYQFWRSRHGFYRGDGAHGQFCLILPQYDAVVAITSGTRDMASVMNLVWDRLVPALKAGALPADTCGAQKLTGEAREPHAAHAVRHGHVGDGHEPWRGSATSSARTSSRSSRSRSSRRARRGTRSRDAHRRRRPAHRGCATRPGRRARSPCRGTPKPIAASGGMDGRRHLHAEGRPLPHAVCDDLPAALRRRTTVRRQSNRTSGRPTRACRSSWASSRRRSSHTRYQASCDRRRHRRR